MCMPFKYPWSLLVLAWLLLVPTNITGISGEPTVLEGNNLQLSCEVSGRPEPNITWTKQEPGNQRNTGVVQEGKVLTITNINRIDAVEFTCAAYNGFGKPEYQTVYVNVTCEYALKKTLTTMLNRDVLSIYFLCWDVLCNQLLVLIVGLVQPCWAQAQFFKTSHFGDLHL